MWVRVSGKLKYLQSLNDHVWWGSHSIFFYVDCSISTRHRNMSQLNSFRQLGIERWLADSLSAMAIREPTPIQAACIGPILEGRV